VAVKFNADHHSLQDDFVEKYALPAVHKSNEQKVCGDLLYDEDGEDGCFLKLSVVVR
jgi:hypothetical protein